MENLIEQRDLGIPGGFEVVSKQVDPTTNDRAARLSPGWDFEPRDIAWACYNSDWKNILGDLLNLAHKPLNLVKRWFGA